MNIKSHGTWSRYEPQQRPEGAPSNAMFARNAEGADWYEYLKGENFQQGTVKMILHDGVVGGIYRDPTSLWPGNNATVLEILDPFEGDPYPTFGNKLYDPATQTFGEAPLPVRPKPPGPTVAELMARIEALEAKG